MSFRSSASSPSTSPWSNLRGRAPARAGLPLGSFLLLVGLAAVLPAVSSIGFAAAFAAEVSPTTVESTTPPVDPARAAGGLLERILPGRSKDFLLETIPSAEGRDVFEVSSAGGKIVVRGSSGVAIASGIDWYLRTIAHSHVSLWGTRVSLADPPPPVPEPVRRECPHRYRYCFNYCVFSYSLAWWDWAEWERAIDWMALRGINMPLAVTGQEAVWVDVLRGFGLEEAEIQSFFVGTAFLPFGWMGCMDGWCGPLSRSWIEEHAALGRRILERERSLGMTPVLQGFTGHVPAALRRVLPEAKLLQLPSWCGFPGTWFLDPTDPTFERVGKAYIEAQTRRFGTDHLYASDTFIEMTPPSGEPSFLDAMGKAVHRAMAAGDPEAVWVLQGWLFVNNPNFWKEPQRKALLRSVAPERLVVLDLFCEAEPTWKKTEAFDGRPWLFCIIQSFGNQVSLHGGLPQIADNLREAFESERRGKISGLGLIMEGLGTNPVVFDYLLDNIWSPRVPEPAEWLDPYLRSRYGSVPAPAREAWALLLGSAYSRPTQPGSVLCGRPRLGVAGGGPDEDVALAWGKLLEAAPELGVGDPYRYDLVNVARQTLSGVGALEVGNVLSAYRGGDRAQCASAGARLVEVLEDLDRLLATHPDFLLGRWIADARRWGRNAEETRLLEKDARTQITLWGPRDSVLAEYAQKEWAGMVRGFYLPRWKIFLRTLDVALAEGKPVDEAKLESELRDFDLAWTEAVDPWPAEARGDPVEIARALWETRGRRVAHEPDSPSLTTGKPVTCSAFLPPHTPQRANDGRTLSSDRYWATDVSTDPAAWWQVDLEEPTRVGRAVLVFYYGDARSYGFRLEGSLDGTRWETLAERKDDDPAPASRTGTSFSFVARPVRYLRVTVTSNSANTGRHLVEVMAFER